MLDVNDLEVVAAAMRVCGFPLAQAAFTRICKALVEAQKTPTNIARVEICANTIESNDPCSYCIYNHTSKCDTCLRGYPCFVGRKLSPVA